MAPAPPLPSPESPEDFDLRVGEAACLSGRLTREDLDAAEAERAREQERAGTSPSLGDILVARRALSASDWRDAVDTLERQEAEQAAAEAEDAQDRLFGHLAARRGWTTEDRIEEALRLQAAMAAKGQRPIPRLGTILVELGHLSHEQAAEVSSLQNKAVLFCPACGRRYEIAGVEAGRAYRCRRCGESLRAAGGDLRPDERAVGPDLLFEPPLPREVEAIADDPSRRFGKYLLVDVLGRGGMGIVHRAWHPERRGFVAVKLFGRDEEAPPSGPDLERFLLEGRTAARLQHRNIVPIYEVGEESGRSYIAMKYIAGETLEGIIRGSARRVWKRGETAGTPPRPGPAEPEQADAAAPRPEAERGPGRLPPRRAAELVREVALAVHYAHQRGVLHRDLKPQNILIDPSGRPHITDFGLALDLRRRRRPAPGRGVVSTGPPSEAPAKPPPAESAPDRGAATAPPSEPRRPAPTSFTIDGFVVGTPAYMAPEQITGERDLDARADVYGLGTILYEALTGRPPFRGVDAEKTAALVLDTPVTPPHEIVRDLFSSELEAICLKALAKDRSLRYASALEMARDLERFLRGESVAARVPRRGQELPPDPATSRGTRWFLLLIAAEIAVIAALLGRILGRW